MKGIRVLEAVAASGSLESAAGVTVDDLCNPGAARSDFVDRLATMAVAYGMAADGMSEQCARVSCFAHERKLQAPLLSLLPPLLCCCRPCCTAIAPAAAAACMHVFRS